MGVGQSDAPDSSQAGRDATQRALAGREPALMIVFCSISHDLTALPRAVRAVAGRTVPLVGCTTAGEIAGSRAGALGAVVVALGGPGLSVSTSVGELARGARAAGQTAAHAITSVDAPNQVLLLLSDGLVGDRLEIVRGAYGYAGASIPIVGGCAGDDLAMQRTYQLYGQESLSNAVIGAAIGSTGPIGVGIGHGFEHFGEPIVVTESNGSRLITLDHRPALDVYLERLGAPPQAYTDPSTWKRFGLLFGLQRPRGHEVRCVRGADYQDRSLLCPDVPQGTLVSTMRGHADAVMRGTEAARDQALAMLNGQPPIGLLAFDCAARRTIIGEHGILDEVATIRQPARDTPLAGFYTMGEFGRVQGSRGVHNTTLVMLALA